MAEQPRVDTMQPSEFQGHDSGFRDPPEGTIARGELPQRTGLATGRQNGEPLTEFPLDVDTHLLERGRERYSIFCQHCHGMTGYGDGMVVQRGFPAPPSYHIDRLRELEIGRMFDVITNGRGRMPAFARRIPFRDRWAIIAYVQALQLSQNAPIDELPDDDRRRIDQTRATSERSQLTPPRSQNSQNTSNTNVESSE